MAIIIEIQEIKLTMIRDESLMVDFIFRSPWYQNMSISL